MRSYLIKTSLFLIFFGSILITLFFGTNSITQSNARIQLDSKIQYAAFGHSHPHVALDDLILTNLKNFALGGESYFYMYPKLKVILDQNPDINTVFIDFTNNQVEGFMDNKIWYDKYISNHFKNYSSFMSVKDYMILLQKNPAGFINGMALSIKLNLNRIMKNQYNFKDQFGSFKPIQGSNIDSLLGILESTERFALTDKPDRVLSTYTLQYLRKSIDYSHQKGVQVFLVRMPQHSEYLGRLNEKYLQKVRNDLFSDIGFLDFNDFPLLDSDFHDLHHLNINGAKKFSNWFKGFLEQQDFSINKEILNYQFQ